MESLHCCNSAETLSGRIRWRIFPFLLIALPAAAAAQQQSLGIFGLWGSFAAKGRCWAVAEPAAAPSGTRPYASIGYVSGRPAAGRAYFRLSRPKREGSAILLRIDGRTFQLRGGGTDSWGSDAAADRDIVSAMRTGVEMSVQTRSATGALVRDAYRLRGAATAIDAAAIACAK